MRIQDCQTGRQDRKDDRVTIAIRHRGINYFPEENRAQRAQRNDRMPFVRALGMQNTVYPREQITW